MRLIFQSFRKIIPFLSNCSSCSNLLKTFKMMAAHKGTFVSFLFDGFTEYSPVVVCIYLRRRRLEREKRERKKERGSTLMTWHDRARELYSGAIWCRTHDPADETKEDGSSSVVVVEFIGRSRVIVDCWPRRSIG